MLKGDITAALGYNTPAGGAVVTSVAPCGIGDRDLGTLGFTTSLGFGRKLERIIADPRIALAFHTREHGYSASPAFVLAQGIASVDLTPSRAQLEALTPQVEHYLGKVMRGPVWDRLLREYYGERVLVDIAVERIAAWPDPSASGEMSVTGAAWPGPADPQPPPTNGTWPRVDVSRAVRQIAVFRIASWPTGERTASRSWCPCTWPGRTRRACAWPCPGGCCRPAAAARGCSPIPTGRNWSG